MATKLRKRHRWHESVLSAPDRIDREAGVIYGVKVLGYRSKNGRDYDKQAVTKAKRLYEGAKVNIDHPNKGDKNGRSFQSRWGVLKNIQEREDGLYADLHYLKAHKLTPVILEAAERFPETFGLSHNASGDEKPYQGRKLVTSIDEVVSVDLVGDPATTNGLFESVTTMAKTINQIIASNKKHKHIKLLEGMVAPSKLAEMDMGDEYQPGEMQVEVPEPDENHSEQGESAVDEVTEAFRAICISILDDDTLDIAAKLSKLKIVLKVEGEVKGVVGDQPSTPATPEVDPMEESEEPVDGEEDENMEESKKVAELKASNQRLLEANQTLQCKELLREMNREVTDLRVSTLLAVSEDKRKPLVESWAEIAKPATKQRPAAIPPASFKESVDVEYPADTKSFREALRRV